MKGGPAKYMQEANQALKSCRSLLMQGDQTGGCNRAYYAMFYAAHAAMQSAGVIAPGSIIKTHAGLVSTFGKEMVLPGLLPAALGSSLGRVLRLRQLSDYDGEAVEAADVEWAISQAESFVASIDTALPALAARGTTP